MTDKMVFQIPAEIVRDKSLSGGGRQFVLETQQNLSPDYLQRLISLENKVGWFTYSSHVIEADDIVGLPPLKPTDRPKKDSERMRATLFRLWEKDNESFKDSDSHYHYYMEKFINHIKEKLD